MSALTDRINAVLRAHLKVWGNGWDETNWKCFCGEAGALQAEHPAHVAERVTEALMSWDFLMALLDEHYPEDVFPTMEDRSDRDPGPRIVSLIRHLDAARRSEVQR